MNGSAATADEYGVKDTRHARLINLVLGVLLLVVLVLSSAWLLAALDTRYVENYIADLGTAENVASLPDWEHANRRLQRAITLQPRQAELYSLSGTLHEWRAFLTGETDPEAALASRRQAMAAYRESIALRPAWPDSWLFLARQKAMLGELDDELRRTLLQGLALGTNEPRIAPLVIEVITLSWPFFAGNEDIAALLGQ